MSKEWKKPLHEHKKMTKYNYVIDYPDKFNMGIDIDIGAFSYINAEYGVKIENNVQIGSHCSIYSNSTIDNKKGKVVIEENCRIGSHTTIMPNITIGKNSTVGAHSFVTKNIPNNEFWVGVPARKK
jgi:acetyltransferase-like isoleucine patch superfamily enzyme